MFKNVAIKDLRPNPFRRLDEYPILREKVDALKDSIAMTGFWGTIVGRYNDSGSVEIAFGHHRLVALRESLGDEGRVEIIVRDLTNEDMMRMMARENMEEWGTSAWIELETIRAVIDAYGKDEIRLRPVSSKTRPDEIRYVSPGSDLHPYTPAIVAEFLGWTKKNNNNGVRPNTPCEIAFHALDLIEAKSLTEDMLKGLSRAQMAAIVKGQLEIRQAQMRAAKIEAENAEWAEERAANAEDASQRRRLEKRAAVHREQAKQAEAAAEQKPKDFARAAVDLYRRDEGPRTVRGVANQYKPTIERGGRVYDMDEFADKIAARFEDFINGDDDLSGHVRFLKRHRDEISPRATEGLRGSLMALIGRVERIASAFKAPTTGRAPSKPRRPAELARP
jgi:hypothetical protein